MSHKTVLYAWGLESPLYQEADFIITVGAKCMNGCSVENMTVTVLDGQKKPLTSAPLKTFDAPSDANTTKMAQAQLNLTAPDKPGLYTWFVVLERNDAHLSAQKPIHFSVTPNPGRIVRLRVTDIKTGSPLSGAIAFFTNTALKKVKPVSATTDEHGIACIELVDDARYLVRVERVNYNGEDCVIDPGNKPVSADVALISTANNRHVVFGPGDY